MKFATAYQPNDTIPANSGEKIVPEYGWTIDKSSGRKIIAQVGKRDIYAPIQEALESTYLSSVLERFQNGGLSVGEFNEYLNAVKGNSSGLFDSIGMPKTLAEVQQSIISADSIFDQLAPEVRDLFQQSKDQFRQSILGGTAQNKISSYLESKKSFSQVTAEKKVEEVKKNES